MPPFMLLIRCTLFLLIAHSVVGADPKSKIQRYGDSLANTVVTVNDSDLAHTHQLLPTELELPEAEQIKEVFRQLGNTIQACGSSADDLIQVNLYVASPKAAVAAHKYLTHSIPPQVRPAVTTVETSLPGDASFGMDAIFAVRQPNELAKTQELPNSGQALNSSLPI